MSCEEIKLENDMLRAKIKALEAAADAANTKVANDAKRVADDVAMGIAVGLAEIENRKVLVDVYGFAADEVDDMNLKELNDLLETAIKVKKTISTRKLTSGVDMAKVEGDINAPLRKMYGKWKKKADK